jgi:SAM-dependent methyltransferase
MGAGYSLAYRVGLAPWGRAGEAGTEQFARLLDREEHERTRPLGRALDIGCGTGRHTIELAERGWTAVGLDNVERAVETAKRRTAAGSTRFVVGDATDLAAAGVGTDIDFFLDIGCFHGLSDARAAARGSRRSGGGGHDLDADQPGRAPIAVR